VDGLRPITEVAAAIADAVARAGLAPRTGTTGGAAR
jgi:hypothetical protein